MKENIYLDIDKDNCYFAIIEREDNATHMMAFSIYEKENEYYNALKEGDSTLQEDNDTEFTDEYKIAEGRVKFDGCTNMTQDVHFCGKRFMIQYNDLLCAVWDTINSIIGH